MEKREKLPVKDMSPTEAEKSFISNIGDFSNEGGLVGRERLLENYERAIDKRQRWDGMNVLEVVKHLRKVKIEAKMNKE